MKLPRLWICILVLCPAVIFANIEQLRSTDGHVRTTLKLLDKLGTKHYQNKRLDDSLSESFLTNYLDTLDPAKNYFLSSDYKDFRQWSYKLDDLTKQGDLSPAFIIFNRYKERVITRLNHNIDLLKTENPFNLTINEFINTEIDDNQWISSTQELDDLWRKRVKDSYLRLVLADKDDSGIRELLTKRYKRQIKRLVDTDSDDVFQYYMNAFTKLYDPHTSYFSPRQLENFNISMSLSLEGIGAVLQVEDENTKVVRIVPGGPADKDGTLSPGDLIVGVGQEQEDIEDVVGWRLDDVVDLIRGAKGTTVRLEVIPVNDESTGINTIFAITRDEVKLEGQAAKSNVIELTNNGELFRFGVIDVPTFYMDFKAYNNRDPNYKSTTRDVSKLLKDLESESVDGIILDLRNNGGGSLREATTLTDLFINPGLVVQIRHANQRISRRLRSRSAPEYKGPLLVLINRLSASASEIFAGAIQDYDRGLIVGTQSYGKGTVQALVPLPEGQIKLTESKFYRVSGESTQHRGVLPDVKLPSLYNIDDIGESNQDHALPWDRIHGVPVNKHKPVSNNLLALQSLHQLRVAMDPDFIHFMDKLAYYKEKKANKQLSLQLEIRQGAFSESEKTLFSFENKRRLAKALKPYTSIDEWKKVDEEDDGIITEKDSPTIDKKPLNLDDDPLLKETAMIFTDQIRLSTKHLKRVVKVNK